MQYSTLLITRAQIHFDNQCELCALTVLRFCVEIVRNYRKKTFWQVHSFQFSERFHSTQRDWIPTLCSRTLNLMEDHCLHGCVCLVHKTSQNNSVYDSRHYIT